MSCRRRAWPGYPADCLRKLWDEGGPGWHNVSMPPTEPLRLTPNEARVLGALVEKEISTPEYYPLSLNALINACNQKSNRDPVTSLDEQTVRGGLEGLREKRLAREVSSFDSRVAKYAHQLAEVFNFDRREIAVLC